MVKRIVAVTCACSSMFAVLGHAQSPDFPTRPVRIVVGFSAGSATDMSARMVGPKLAELWGQPVVIENRPGAGSTLANTMVAKATPDGHTILTVSTSFTINAVLPAKAPYDPIKDFAAVTQIGYSTGVVVAAPALGVKTLKELEGYSPQEIIDRLTAPMLQTVNRIRKALALQNRCLAGDQKFAVEFKQQMQAALRQ